MNYLDEAVTKSLDEFMEYYKVVDTEEIYSNGTEFVPIFRVKQWEEYNNKDKEVERLTKQNKALNEMYELTKKEYIRLNNIINELEKYFEQEGFWHSLDKIKELKGSDDNE